MAATVKVYYDWGGTDGSPGTSQNVTNNGTNKIRFKTADDDTIDTNNPIPVPTSGTNYSFWKHVYMQVSTAVGLTKIDNVQFYGDGAVFDYTGVTLNVSTATPNNTALTNYGYAVAVGTAAVTGTILTGHGSVSAVASATGYTSGSPLTVSISEASNQLDATGEKTDYIIMQLAVTDAASSGTLTAETLTISYDEI